MAILGKLLNTLRNALLIAFAATSIASGQQAPIENIQPDISKSVISAKKTIQDNRFAEMTEMFKSPVNNPYDSFDSNIHFLQATNDYFGEIINSFAKKYSLEGTISERAIVAILYNELNASTSILSHEIAHYPGLRRVSPDAEIIFSFPIFYMNSAIFFGMDYPKIAKPIYLDDKIFHIVSGLNINELAAEAYAKETLETMTLQDAFSYLHAKLLDDFYSLADFVMPDPRSDLTSYLKGITNIINNLPQTREQLTWMLLLPDILSLRVYNAINSIYHYIATGENETEASTIFAGNNTISYPDISCYLTPQGIAYNLMMQMKDNEDFIYTAEISGNPFYPMQTKYNQKRIAIGVRNSEDAFSIEGAITYDKQLSFSHISLTKTLRGDNGSLTVGIEYSSGDLIENTVKGKKDGITFRLSADIDF